jgi:hypothetical protein
MCNDYEQHVRWAEYRRLMEALDLAIPSHQTELDLPRADDIRINDTGPVMRAAGDKVELVPMAFAFPPARLGGAPVFNFRSEGRHFAKSNRCLIPASAFFEFMGKKYPKAKNPARPVLGRHPAEEARQDSIPLSRRAIVSGSSYRAESGPLAHPVAGHKRHLPPREQPPTIALIKLSKVATVQDQRGFGGPIPRNLFCQTEGFVFQAIWRAGAAFTPLTVGEARWVIYSTSSAISRLMVPSIHTYSFSNQLFTMK